MAGYYDIVLGLIPLVLAGLSGALLLAGVTQATALVVGSLVGVGVVGHAMFVRTPVSPKRPVDAGGQSGMGPATGD